MSLELMADPSVLEASERVFHLMSKMQQMKDSHGISLYAHLKDCLRHLLSREPHYPVETFEFISKGTYKNSISQPYEYENPASRSMALIRKNLFITEGEAEDEPVVEEGVESPMPNLLHVSHFLSRGGVGLSQIEFVHLGLALKNLVEKYPVQSVRFWGKIFGLEQNYYVVEATFAEGEELEEDAEEAADEEQDKDNEAHSDEEENEQDVKDKLPKSSWKPPQKIPKEENNQGTNSKVYFVTHNPGVQWVKLPPVTPEQIVISRQIRCLMVGKLDAPVVSSPPFPGVEANYLRAQIARISACTQVSPEGYFQMGDGEEEEEVLEDDGDVQKCSPNAEYEPLPVFELADPTLRNWVHHVPYILPQGRCSWYNPNRKGDDEYEEMDEEGEEGAFAQIAEPQRGPPILTHLSDDLALFGKPAWTVRMHSEMNLDYAVVTVSSTIWPGAHAVAFKKSFENVYVGWAVKAVGPGHNPTLPLASSWMQEHAEQMKETVDPTPAEEAALRAAKLGDQGEEAMPEEEAGEEEQD
ncbi:Radial spoke head protein 4 A [Cichlidogyrus casuarinus]|uniref:Radial spoke head protein 4 A n=1 Tax=Cichlidogyrus casuarinus TaxID=1844966 RepID=A0ABD2QJ52_9PLAT